MKLNELRSTVEAYYVMVRGFEPLEGMMKQIISKSLFDIFIYHANMVGASINELLEPEWCKMKLSKSLGKEINEKLFYVLDSLNMVDFDKRHLLSLIFLLLDDIAELYSKKIESLKIMTEKGVFEYWQADDTTEIIMKGQHMELVFALRWTGEFDKILESWNLYHYDNPFHEDMHDLGKADNCFCHLLASTVLSE